MSSVTSKELKNHTGEVLQRVRRGERVTVTRRGRPIAVILSIDDPATRALDGPRDYPTAWDDLTETLRESEAAYGSWEEAMDATRRRR
jgi:prevent-host-death family protein